MSVAPSVAVVAVGDGIDTAGIIDRLQRIGLMVTDDRHAATLLVTLTDDHLRPGLAALNAAALATDRPWLLARPGGRQLWLGPLLRPGHGACWTCLAERLRTNRAVSRPRATDSVPPPLDTVPAITADSGRDRHRPRGRQGPCRRTHRRRRRHRHARLDHPRTHDAPDRAPPPCPSCGDATPRPPTTPRLDVSATEDTWHRCRHHVSPITGLVPRLIAVPTPTVAALHLYVVGNGSPVAGDDALAPIPPRHGRGAPAPMPDSRVRALGEALEVRSGTRQGDEPVRTARWCELDERASTPTSSSCSARPVRPPP